MIVEKAEKMAQLMHIPVLGLVENMAYFRCPDCGRVHALFGESHARQQAEEYGIPAFTSLPMDPAITRAIDEGKVEQVQVPELDALLERLLK